MQRHFLCLCFYRKPTWLSLTIESTLTVIVKRLSKINILLIFIYLIVLFYKSVTRTLNWIKREVASWSEFVPVTKSEKEDHFEVHPIRERLIQKLFYKLFFQSTIQIGKMMVWLLKWRLNGFLQESWPLKMRNFFDEWKRTLSTLFIMSV